MGMQINEKVIYKTFRKSAEAMIMGNITAFIGTAVDSLITSRMLGVSYVSSFQLVQPLILFVTLLGNVICSGLQSVYSRQIGAGKIRDAHTTMSVSSLILLVICGMCATVYCVFAHQLVSGLGASDVSSLFHGSSANYSIYIFHNNIFASSNLCLQRPYIVRFIVFKPLLQSLLTACSTAL